MNEQGKTKQETIYLMECMKCKKEFDEKKIEVSHDVPKYLFVEKNEADKWGRHNLCNGCHNEYEKRLFGVLMKSIPLNYKDNLKNIAKEYAEKYFGGEDGDSNSKK